VWLSDPALTGTGSLLVVRVHMPPGRGHQFHAHPELDEIIYVVDGVAEQWVDRGKRLLRSGEVAYIPKGVVHATHNPTRRPLTFLAILSPASSAGPAVVDHFNEEPWRSLRKPIIYRDVDPETGRRLGR
jgi:quercetin dioxygenase-like cupin family protein